MSNQMSREQADADMPEQQKTALWAEYKALDTALTALRGPQPDPITGLMPCGCGGKAQLGKLQYTISDPDLMTEYYVYCQDCGITNENSADRERVENEWNTAMSGGMCNHEN